MEIENGVQLLMITSVISEQNVWAARDNRTGEISHAFDESFNQKCGQSFMAFH
jgi:hypothetical protein